MFLLATDRFQILYPSDQHYAQLLLFLVLENHSVDNPWWDDLVVGLPNPIIQGGYIKVPETPGLGIDLNSEVIQQHLHSSDSEYFPPTSEWENERSHDRLWS